MPTLTSRSLQAQSRKSNDHGRLGILRLDDFLRMTERDVLTHAGKVAAEVAQAKAETEFERYRPATACRPQPRRAGL
jgi:hypothetical protein